jgi:hypothetical protein
MTDIRRKMGRKVADPVTDRQPRAGGGALTSKVWLALGANIALGWPFVQVIIRWFGDSAGWPIFPADQRRREFPKI